MVALFGGFLEFMLVNMCGEAVNARTAGGFAVIYAAAPAAVLVLALTTFLIVMIITKKEDK